MLLLSAPMLSMRLGTSDDGTKPESTTQRRAYDLLADGFGPGFNAPLTAVVDLTDAADADSTLAAFSAAADQHPGTYAVGDPSVSAASSDERRGGKEWASPCRSRLSPGTSKKK